MKTSEHYFIPGRHKGLVSSEDPFGDRFLGPEDLLVTKVNGLNVSGIVEFYMSSDCRKIGKDSKIALGFSDANTSAALLPIKSQFEKSVKQSAWDDYLEGFRETHCKGDREHVKMEQARLAEEGGVENMYADFWSIKTLNAIRKEFILVGVLEYKAAKKIDVLVCGKEFEKVLNNGIGGDSSLYNVEYSRLPHSQIKASSPP